MLGNIWVRKASVLLVAVAMTCGCAHRAPRTLTAPPEVMFREQGKERLGALGEQIGAVFDRQEFAQARWGVFIRSYDTQEVVYERNETQTFAPASNEKIFTTVGSLMLLGPEFRYSTQFYSTGDLAENGSLNGDLIVQGNGNFWLGSTRPDRNLDNQLAGLATECLGAGIHEIKGDLIGDDTWIDSHVTGWRVGSVVLDHNQIHATLFDGGQRMEVTPALPTIKVIDQVERLNSDSQERSQIRLRQVPKDSPDYLTGAHAFYLTGRIKPGETLTGTGSLQGAEPVQFYLDALRAAFLKHGIAIGGSTRIIKVRDENHAALMDKATFRFQSLSPPLWEIVRWTNKPSDNYRAERLFLTCGQSLTTGTSTHSGEKAIKGVLLKFGIRPELYHLEDGSGLSRNDQVRPFDIVRILDAMRETSYFPVFYDSLPIAGVDGTLVNRMKNTPAENNVHAKTGHIRGVTALSGYVTSLAGERFTFSMIINDNKVESAVPDGAENEVCALLAGFSR